MVLSNGDYRARLGKLVALLAGTSFILGFLETCDNRLISLTRFAEPCGTFLANCAPGDFLLNRSSVGDSCDVTCTLPGGCLDDPPLSTIREFCP